MTFFEFHSLKCDKEHPYDIALTVLQVFSLILSVIIIILSRNITFDGEISRSISDDLIDNFNTGYYTDFSKSSSNMYLSELLEEKNENLVKFGVWEGTKKGCGKDGEAKVLEEGKKCDKNEEIINDFPRTDITKYKGISITGISKKNYYDLLYDVSIIKKGEDCPTGKINVGYIDTLENKLCLDNSNNLARPISYVQISNTVPAGINNIQTITGTNINLYFSTNPYQDSTSDIPKIFNSFKIADSNDVCSLPNLYSFNYVFHSLDNYKKEYADKCNLIYDYKQKYTKDAKRYHKLDTINLYQLLNENGIIDRINNSKLKNYKFDVNVYESRDVSLYIRMHYGFDKDCLDKRKAKLNVDSLGIIYGRADNIITWGTNILYLIPNLIASFTDFFTATTYITLEIIIKYILIITPSFGLTIYTFIARRYDDPYEDDMTCSDAITNDNFNVMIARIIGGGKKIVATSVLLVFLLIINIASLIIRIIIQCKKSNK